MTTRRIVAALVLAMLPMVMMAAQGAVLPAPEATWAFAIGLRGWEAFIWIATGALMCGGPLLAPFSFGCTAANVF